MNEQRIKAIRQSLERRFDPEFLDIEDQSHLHEGHDGARSGKGHFHVTIVADAFRGMAPLERHKAVFQALGALMDTDIHALSLRAIATDEF